jgi:hypothetical protein
MSVSPVIYVDSLTGSQYIDREADVDREQCQQKRDTSVRASVRLGAVAGVDL